LSKKKPNQPTVYVIAGPNGAGKTTAGETMTKTIHGKVYGRTIELDEDLGVAEGQEVEVQSILERSIAFRSLNPAITSGTARKRYDPSPRRYRRRYRLARERPDLDCCGLHQSRLKSSHSSAKCLLTMTSVGRDHREVSRVIVEKQSLRRGLYQLIIS
jgi:hypothetical protein